MSKRVLALIAALVATSIFGINHTLAKGLMPDYVQPLGFIVIRVLGAGILFWIVSLFIKNEKIKKEHWPRLLLSALFGMVLNMLFFFKGLSLSTPINSSVIVTITPILVFVLSALLIREKITWLKGSGAVIGLFGGLTLILFGVQQQVDAPNIPLGNAMIFINAMSYGMFLIVAKPLTKTYHPVTLMRWLFLTAIIINLPIGWTEFVSVEWQALPFSAIWRIGFVIVGTTFLTYLLNIFALKYLSASTIGVFVYLQPVIAIAFAIISGADELNGLKIISAILVFLGVFMVTKNPSRKRAKA
ncbi:DMT family transporter [Psychroflexus gondwanensis]|jgi:drug/metabolite transporter (DMT)-like permease|uniref:Transporter permease, EamA superfamily protein n=1 Tax=Psychroflexus gondwanensis ACAM 44 TaxID=1189619 RepID=N1WVP1_9FLAO|nr:DMT family transporter [Psychroflexus gondwanensis]EMY81277.1 transporter permease, EamA superfamily protein [Psychroflexus gondwanensis ACAM 44]TXE18143.1 DMT family transporter [Psychroflexus gondwanensis]